MKFFKNIKIGVATLALAFTFNACDGWLDPDPLSFYTPENAFRDYRGLMAGTHMLQRDLRFLDYVPGGLSVPPGILTELTLSDLVVNAMDDNQNIPQDFIRQLMPQLVNSDAGGGAFEGIRVGAYWRLLFQGIRDANLILTRAEEAHFDNQEQKNRILAIGRFHRAIRYYRLVHQFGDVPLIMDEIRTPRFDFYSTQREVILRYMKRDLEEVAEFLPQNTHRGTVNQGAMFHLLTMINLALGEFEDAIYTASRVIDGGFHALMETRFGIDADDPNRNVIWDLHRPANKRLLTNREAIFIVLDEFGELGGTAHGLEVMRNMLPWWSNNQGGRGIQVPAAGLPAAATWAFVDNNETLNPLLAQIGRGVGRARPTGYIQSLIWNLDNTDLRRCRESGNWIDMEDLQVNNPALRVPDARGIVWYGKNLTREPIPVPTLPGEDGHPGTTYVSFFVGDDGLRNWYGWPQYKTFIGEQRVAHWRGGNSDWYVFRLAATYLFRAEAHYWLGNYAEAAADINRVRVRAGARPITAAEVDMRMILDERARELFMEEPRKTELTRISFLYAKTGKTSYLGTTYNMATFSQSNFWFDHIMATTDFYNQGVRTRAGNYFTLAPHHVLWPVPENAIAVNVQGRINQNWGYPGFENNRPPIDRPN